MSIFKETLDEGIQTQLQARTLVVSGINNNRSDLLPWYLSKNAWVRMTSFVDFNEGVVDFDGKGGIVLDDTKGHYKGNQLSKKYILEGGTLYENKKTLKNELRKGIAKSDAIYGARSIDLRSDGTADSQYFRQLGIRPMPGITDVSMRTIGAYGSLFETTVNFHAWDSNQLNELELLFMRPGYSVLLEWGWSQFLSYPDSFVDDKDKLSRDSLEAKVFFDQTIDAFKQGQTPITIYGELERLRKKYRYNYDGMLGYVKNFSWKLRKDGGYDCSTTLISMGEVINTIKLSTNANNIVGASAYDVNSTTNSVYDDFERVLLSLKSRAEEKVIVNSIETINEEEYKGIWSQSNDYIDIDEISTKLADNGYKRQADILKNQQPITQNLNSNSPQGMIYEYISLDVLIAIISSYAALKSKPKGTDGFYRNVDFIVPGESDFCLAGPDTISVHPDICNIKNYGAFEPELKAFYFENGHQNLGQGIYPALKDISGNAWNIEFYENKGRGYIRNILVNIDFLLSAYKSIKTSSSESGVNLTDFLKNVLNKISNSLGGLNNFVLSTAGKNQNTLKIIDTYYLGQENYNSKYQFDLLGLGSICKDVQIESQIFQEQSTIVAIAAQSRANLGDVYNSTQVYLNAGLVDRLSEVKFQGNEDDPILINKNYFFYKKLIPLMLYARDYLVGNNSRYSIETNTELDRDPHTLLKQALLKYDGAMNFKALIPFKLRITLEGIGGIVVGQIFTVKQNILPKNYYDKRLGFIITKIEHTLRNNQWETILDTQICILDQDQFYEADGSSKLTNKIDRGGLADFLAIQNLSVILWPIFIDYITYQLTRSVIGFIYSATNQQDVYADKWIYDNMYKNYDPNSSIVKTYWANNVDYFIESKYLVNPSDDLTPVNKKNRRIRYNTIGGLGQGFDAFVDNWLDTWADQNSTILDEIWSSSLTIRDAITFIKNRNYVSTTEEYKSFKPTYDAIITLIGRLTGDLFYPNNSSNNNFFNMGGNYNPFNLISGTKEEITGTDFINFNINGWQKTVLEKKIEEVVRNFTRSSDLQPLNDMIEGYKQRRSFSGGRRSLNQYFSPNSKIMYADPSVSLTGAIGSEPEKSLIIDEAWNETAPVGKNDPNLNQALFTWGFHPDIINGSGISKGKNEIWINTILFNKPFTTGTSTAYIKTNGTTFTLPGSKFYQEIPITP